jgi:dUTP pyrophosphatase
MLELQVELLDEHAKVPTKAYDKDAGLDIYALHKEVVRGPMIEYGYDDDDRFRGGEVSIIRTGIAVKIPDGYFGLIGNRSSMGKRGLIVMGAIIDSSYTGELMIMLTNNTDEPHRIEAGDKIAQLLILPVPQVTVKVVDELPNTARGQSGFGSSGR